MDGREIVRAFWDAMNSNDFHAAAKRWLAPDYVGLWPQTGEVIRGPAQYGAVNSAFPGMGGWHFTEASILAEGARVVSDTRITNPGLEVVIHALTFHDIQDGLIARQTEYWPDSYPVPEWRKGLLKIDHDLARW